MKMSGLSLLESDRKVSHLMKDSRRYEVVFYLDPKEGFCIDDDCGKSLFLCSDTVHDWIFFETNAKMVINGTELDKPASETMGGSMPRQVWQCLPEGVL